MIEGTIPVALIDVVMPGMNGTELQDGLRERFPGIRILYMSGYMQDGVSSAGINIESADFVQKPFQTAALGERVRVAAEKMTMGGAA